MVENLVICFTLRDATWVYNVSSLFTLTFLQRLTEEIDRQNVFIKHVVPTVVADLTTDGKKLCFGSKTQFFMYRLNCFAHVHFYLF